MQSAATRSDHNRAVQHKSGRLRTHRALCVAVLLAFGIAPSGRAQTFTFSSTGSLHTARFHHTATLLPNQKVLVAGGYDTSTNTLLTSCELYDPHTGSWSLTGNLLTATYFHTATLLPNGTVLVAGGRDLNNFNAPIGAAEIYDPATGTWTVTGSLNTPRFGHTPTLLPNGKVLIVGGVIDQAGDTTASSELYDPATGAWTTTGSLQVARCYQTVTLLADGLLLMAGGQTARDFSSGATDLNSAQVYIANPGCWDCYSSTPALTTIRSAHTATLLPNGKVLVAGGGTNTQSFNTSELYSGGWNSTGRMVTARDFHTATLLGNGKVLVTGGRDEATATSLSSCEVYDPASGIYSITGSLSADRAEHTATLLADGRVLIVGGYKEVKSQTGVASKHLTFDPIDSL